MGLGLGATDRVWKLDSIQGQTNTSFVLIFLLDLWTIGKINNNESLMLEV